MIRCHLKLYAIDALRIWARHDTGIVHKDRKLPRGKNGMEGVDEGSYTLEATHVELKWDDFRVSVIVLYATECRAYWQFRAN